VADATTQLATGLGEKYFGRSAGTAMYTLYSISQFPDIVRSSALQVQVELPPVSENAGKAFKFGGAGATFLFAGVEQYLADRKNPQLGTYDRLIRAAATTGFKGTGALVGGVTGEALCGVVAAVFIETGPGDLFLTGGCLLAGGIPGALFGAWVGGRVQNAALGWG
jgi:hypothetical protein